MSIHNVRGILHTKCDDGVAHYDILVVNQMYQHGGACTSLNWIFIAHSAMHHRESYFGYSARHSFCEIRSVI